MGLETSRCRKVNIVLPYLILSTTIFIAYSLTVFFDDICRDKVVDTLLIELYTNDIVYDSIMSNVINLYSVEIDSNRIIAQRVVTNIIAHTTMDEYNPVIIL